jgi:16S rRNA (guanine(966)-N(2))-methyltransferase RsmD
MRVVGGALRGRRLRGPPENVRPTSDRVRESLFAILGNLEGLAVLDLYAGTGALGIEALSRGAARVVFVDRSQRSLTVLRRNLADLGLEDRAVVIRSEVLRCLDRWNREGREGPFELVLADPPYADREIARVLEALAAGHLLGAGAEVVVESAKRNPWKPPRGFVREDERRYGDTVLTRLSVAGGSEVPPAPGRRSELEELVGARESDEHEP